MLILTAPALAATLQVVAPSGRVLSEQPLSDAAETVVMWRGQPRRVVVASAEGRWDAEITAWRHGRQVEGLMLSATKRPGGCISLTGEPTRDALALVINDGGSDCFEQPVPYVNSISRLSPQHSQSVASRESPNLFIDSSDRFFAMLYEGSKLNWRVTDDAGYSWSVQVGVTEIRSDGLETIVAWRRAEPVLFWHPTVASTATLPYGSAVALAGPTELTLRAERP